MRRTLLASLVLFAVARTPAAAQTCMGLASFNTAPVQFTGSGQLTQLKTSVAATAGYGIPSSLWGVIGLSRSMNDDVESHRLGMSARVGYQVALDPLHRIEVCPTVSFGLGLGPDAPGVDRFGRTASVGVSAGMTWTANPRMHVVPSAGLSYAHGLEKAENATGTTLFRISSSYALLQAGVGIILNSTLSLRPSVEIPFGLDGTPTVGFTVGYNFGRSLP